MSLLLVEYSNILVSKTRLDLQTSLLVSLIVSQPKGLCLLSCPLPVFQAWREAIVHLTRHLSSSSCLMSSHRTNESPFRFHFINCHGGVCRLDSLTLSYCSVFSSIRLVASFTQLIHPVCPSLCVTSTSDARKFHVKRDEMMCYVRVFLTTKNIMSDMTEKKRQKNKDARTGGYLLKITLPFCLQSLRL